MPSPPSPSLDSGLLEQLIARLRGEARDEIEGLLKRFAQGEIAKEQMIKSLIVLYQTSFGGVARSLVALDEDAARDWSAFLRKDIDRAMADIEAGESASLSKAQKPSTGERLKSKKGAVLRREQVLLKELTKTDRLFTLAQLVELLTRAKSLDSTSDPEAVLTAHLDRLTKDGVIARPRKGHYGSTPGSKSYLKALGAELEARTD